MRILFVSHAFPPGVGGIERVSVCLAGELVRQGHELALVTHTPGAAAQYPFAVTRRPEPRALLDLHRWCDVCFHNNISLRSAWPLLAVSRPWVVAHHVWIPRAGLAARLKRLALRRAIGISVSGAIAAHLDTPSIVIPNPYDDTAFGPLPGVERGRDLIFVGRLVSDKGVDTLLDAVAALRNRSLEPSVTIVGDGPEGPALRARAARLGLDATIRFTGMRDTGGVVRLLNEHRILVVPSRWAEPFGLVALEGIACGCVPVGSADGGLRDAIGDCGETFPNGDVAALTDALERLLRNPARLAALRARAAAHLARHSTSAVAARYVRTFEEALSVHGRPLARDASRA